MTTWTHTSTDSDPTHPTYVTTSLLSNQDIDGNVYGTVEIDGLVWMTENLKTTRYKDGTTIPRVTVNDDWKVLTTGARCEYLNDASSESDTYGF